MMNNIVILDFPNPRKVRVYVDRNWLYTTVVDSPDISSEEEGDHDFTNINASTTMEDDTTPSIRPTYNEAKMSTEDQDI